VLTIAEAVVEIIAAEAKIEEKLRGVDFDE
jgi:hypothetical protein